MMDSSQPFALPEQIGDFRIVQLLGQGGMGAVYLAEDVRLQRRVALKVMKAEVASNPDSAERFLREARAAAKLEHDHIVTIYTVGEAKQPDGRPLLYLAMPLLKGEPLDARIRRNEGHPLPLDEQLTIGRQIAEGLSAAHLARIARRWRAGNAGDETDADSGADDVGHRTAGTEVGVCGCRVASEREAVGCGEHGRVDSYS